MRSANRRGLIGEHWAWFLIAGTAYVLRRARRPGGSLVTSVPVTAGQRIQISVRDPRAASPSADT